MARSSPIRVLHVWNTAGVASVIAKFTDRARVTSSEVMTRTAADPMGLTTYGKTYPDGPFRFLLRAAMASGGFDLIHVHSLDRIVPWVKRIHSRKPMVMLYHGTDILGRWEEKRSRWARADVVGYSTPNLSEGAPERAMRYANPVDTDYFHPVAGQRVPQTALSIRYGMDAEAMKVATERSLVLTLVDRGSVQHREMPALLSKFEYFIDLRRPPSFKAPVESVGKAALESLACGCKVVDWSGRVLESLPEENRPEVVAAKWAGVYGSLLD